MLPKPTKLSPSRMIFEGGNLRPLNTVTPGTSISWSFPTNDTDDEIKVPGPISASVSTTKSRAMPTLSATRKLVGERIRQPAPMKTFRPKSILAVWPGFHRSVANRIVRTTERIIELIALSGRCAGMESIEDAVALVIFSVESAETFWIRMQRPHGVCTSVLNPGDSLWLHQRAPIG